MKTKNREGQIHLRVTKEEQGMFTDLAEERRQTVAVLVRDLVRREHRRVFGMKEAKAR